jgi:hypothetical protein
MLGAWVGLQDDEVLPDEWVLDRYPLSCLHYRISFLGWCSVLGLRPIARR